MWTDAQSQLGRVRLSRLPVPASGFVPASRLPVGTGQAVTASSRLPASGFRFLLERKTLARVEQDLLAARLNPHRQAEFAQDVRTSNIVVGDNLDSHRSALTVCSRRRDHDTPPWRHGPRHLTQAQCHCTLNVSYI